MDSNTDAEDERTDRGMLLSHEVTATSNISCSPLHLDNVSIRHLPDRKSVV